MRKFLTGLTLFLISAICVCGLFACGGVEFKINFIVDGEVYATVKTGGAETIRLPDNPEKDDYTFDGWFWDKDTWHKPFTANSLLDAPLSSDMNVYAKWTFVGEITPPEPEPTPEITEYFEKKQDGSYYGKVYNTTTQFDFTGRIDYDGEYFVCTDAACTKTLADNKTTLNAGDNIFYILFDNGNKTTATVRRRTICTVTFDTANGTAVAPQTVEEDKRTPAPKNPMRIGYTFSAWDYDFNEPITANTTVTAIWNANTNTPYKIEYYLQNLEDDNYTLQENDTENLTGTTDTQATTTKTYEHFTVIENTASDNINADGSTVLKVYYTRDIYTIKISSDTGVSLNKTYNVTYKYGYIIPEITATFNNYLGCEWQGWQSDNLLLTEEFTIPSFTVDKNIDYYAKSIKSEMSNFKFTSTATACTITGVKDKTVKEIIVPDYVTNINQGAFSGCSSLESITIPFVGGSRKTENDTYQYPFGYIFGTGSYMGGTKTVQYYYGSSTSSITSTTYYIPSTLKSVTVTGGNILRGAFKGCSLLTSITIPDSVTSIGHYAFNGCSLTSITIPDSVTSIGDYVFSGCSLTSITIPDSVTSIGEDAFGCRSLTSINVSENNANYKSLDGNLYSKDGKTLIKCATGKIASSITIPDSVTSIGSYAFSNCSSLISITIPDSVTSIGSYAFSNCSSLISITIPDSVTSIGRYAFSNCSSLTSITIPDSVTSIGNYAFYGCSSLTSIKFNDTTTWYKTNNYTDWQGKTGGTQTSVTNSTTNATNFKSTYNSYYWYKL